MKGRGSFAMIRVLFFMSFNLDLKPLVPLDAAACGFVLPPYLRLSFFCRGDDDSHLALRRIRGDLDAVIARGRLDRLDVFRLDALDDDDLRGHSSDGKEGVRQLLEGM